MFYKLQYHKLVVSQDLLAIPNGDLGMLRRAIELRLVKDPLKYAKPLRRSLRGYQKLRVGNYRIIFRVEVNEHLIRVLVIQNRRDVYQNARKRID